MSYMEVMERLIRETSSWMWDDVNPALFVGAIRIGL